MGQYCESFIVCCTTTTQRVLCCPSTPSMSNLWFFRLRSGSTSPLSTMERRRSSSERASTAAEAVPVSIEVQQHLGSSSYTTVPVSTPPAGSLPMSTTMSRLHSARSSTASYCGMIGLYGDVPPLHRKSFLGPGNIANADSLDNVAQLIPR